MCMRLYGDSLMSTEFFFFRASKLKLKGSRNASINHMVWWATKKDYQLFSNHRRKYFFAWWNLILGGKKSNFFPGSFGLYVLLFSRSRFHSTVYEIGVKTRSVRSSECVVSNGNLPNGGNLVKKFVHLFWILKMQEFFFGNGERTVDSFSFRIRVPIWHRIVANSGNSRMVISDDDKAASFFVRVFKVKWPTWNLLRNRTFASIDIGIDISCTRFMWKLHSVHLVLLDTRHSMYCVWSQLHLGLLLYSCRLSKSLEITLFQCNKWLLQMNGSNASVVHESKIQLKNLVAVMARSIRDMQLLFYQLCSDLLSIVFFSKDLCPATFMLCHTSNQFVNNNNNAT